MAQLTKCNNNSCLLKLGQFFQPRLSDGIA